MKKFTAILSLALITVVFTGAKLESSFNTGINIEKNNSSVLPNDRTVQKEFNVKPGGKLYINLKPGGSIKIEGWSKNVVSVRAELSGRDADDVNVDMEQNGDEITVESYYDGGRHNYKCKEKVYVSVPEKFNVDFSTMGGDVSLNKVSGTLEGKTMGGALDLTNLNGDLDITTMGGEINVRDCNVDGKVKTMGGQVLVENVNGDLNATSMGGKVSQRNVNGNKNSSGSAVSISTMGGPIDVDNAPNGAKVKTMGGDIKVNSVSKFINAETYGGDIEIKKVDGSVEAKTYGGNVDVNLVGTGDNKDVEITSLGGDITVNIPSNFSMDVNVEIAYTRDWDEGEEGFQDAKIEGDFKLDESKTDKWERKHGSARKYLRGKGSFNGGKNKVTIKTINGTVTLNKS